MILPILYQNSNLALKNQVLEEMYLRLHYEIFNIRFLINHQLIIYFQ